MKIRILYCRKQGWCSGDRAVVDIILFSTFHAFNKMVAWFFIIKIGFTDDAFYLNKVIRRTDAVLFWKTIGL